MAKKQKWYVTKQPKPPYEEYDFASNDEQAKDMLESLSYMGAIAELSDRQGGKYVIWILKPISINRRPRNPMGIGL